MRIAASRRPNDADERALVRAPRHLLEREHIAVLCGALARSPATMAPSPSLTISTSPAHNPFPSWSLANLSEHTYIGRAPLVSVQPIPASVQRNLEMTLGRVDDLRRR